MVVCGGGGGGVIGLVRARACRQASSPRRRGSSEMQPRRADGPRYRWSAQATSQHYVRHRVMTLGPRLRGDDGGFTRSRSRSPSHAFSYTFPHTNTYSFSLEREHGNGYGIRVRVRVRERGDGARARTWARLAPPPQDWCQAPQSRCQAPTCSPSPASILEQMPQNHVAHRRHREFFRSVDAACLSHQNRLLRLRLFVSAV